MTTSEDPEKSVARRVLVVALVVAVALLCWLAVTKTRDNSHATVTAIFVDSSPLTTGNKVQIDGVEIGKITAIRLVDGRSHVEMPLGRSALPLHSDASAKIEPVSLLGERFVALSQGSPAAPVLTDPMTIPDTTLGESISGQGDSVAQTLRVVPPNLHQVDLLATMLDKQNTLLTNLIVAAQRNATAFSQPLDSLVGSARLALSSVAANRQAMDASVRQLPGTLTSARRTVNDLATMADNTTHVLADLRPLTDNLVRTSGELSEFARSAKPALRSMPDLLDRTDQLLDQARPVVRTLHRTSGELRSASGSINRVGTQILTHPADVPSQLENAMTGLANWGMTTTGYDGLSHYFRAVVVATPSTLGTTVLGPLPPVGARPPFNPIRPDFNGQRGYPATKTLPFMPALPNPDGSDNGSGTAPTRGPGTLPGDRDEPGSATGLTSKQESNMLDQVLGGGN
jgi:phospholipid/cholesterol/gamma-HCH transport system substrate-binding protein